jgi:LCCL domain-containing protein
MASGGVRGDEPRADSIHATKPIDWQTSPLDLDLRGMNGERYTFACPPGKPQPSRISGSGPYTDDSSICTAAVHAGVIHARDGGGVTIEVRPARDTYPGSERNYIRSASYGQSWGGSFVVLGSDAEPSPSDHSPRKP